MSRRTPPQATTCHHAPPRATTCRHVTLQVVPAPLLKFALSILRGVFGSGALHKAVWTFAFDRRTHVTAELLDKYRAAVVTDPRRQPPRLNLGSHHAPLRMALI